MSAGMAGPTELGESMLSATLNCASTNTRVRVIGMPVGA